MTSEIVRKFARVDGTSRRSQRLEISVREARLRKPWTELFIAWRAIVNTSFLQEAFRARSFPVDEFLLRFRYEADRRLEAMVEALSGAPILRQGPLDTALGPLTVQTLAENQVASRVVELTNRQRDGLRSQLVSLFSEPEVTTARLEAISEATGLTRRMTRAVDARRLRLLSGGVGKLEAARNAKAYASRLRSARARLIARTEAVDFTARIVEARAQAAGNMVKQWVSARDNLVDSVCLAHDNGEIVDVGRSFSAGLSRPPAHPGCRCVLEVFRADIVPPQPPRRRRRPVKPPTARVRRPRKPIVAPRPKPTIVGGGDARTAAQVGGELREADRKFGKTIARAQGRHDELKLVTSKAYSELSMKGAQLRARGLDPFDAIQGVGYARIRRRAVARGRSASLAGERVRKLKMARRERLIPIIEREEANRAPRAFVRLPKGGKNLAKARAGLAMFERLVHRDALAAWKDTRYRNGVHVQFGRGRAIHRKAGNVLSGGGPMIRVKPTDDVGTFLHEMGHAVETTNTPILQRSLAWRDKRTAGEPLQRLRDLVPSSHYRFDEQSRPDAFFHPYVGKTYGSRASEIFSMGLQQMWRDPVELLNKDPSMFAHVWDVMRGAIP